MPRLSSTIATAALVAAGLSVAAVADDQKTTSTTSSNGTQVAQTTKSEPGTQPAPDAREREIQELKRIIQELQKRVEDLEKKGAEPKDPAAPAVPDPSAEPEPETPPVPEPPVIAPAEDLPAGAPPPTTGSGSAGATFLPNISVVGNLIARAGDSKATPGRGQVLLDELEVAFQDQVAPKLRYDAFLAAEREEDWGVHLEEGYLTASALLPGLTLRAGRMFTPIGKFNPLHAHQWLFITRPSASTALLGDHGLSSDGAVATYILPIRGLYAGLDFGVWRTGTHGEEHGDEHAEEDEHDHDHEHDEGPIDPHELGFRGGDKNAFSTRLHLSKGLGLDKELEFGVSRYWGRGEVEGFGRKMMAINGLDLTYRSYPGAFKRLWLTAELLLHETRSIDGDTRLRPGGFLMGAYRWNRYWEAGIRGDYTKYPFPFDGKEWGASLFLTKYLTEQTSLRLEYRNAFTTGIGNHNSIYFQVLFGAGPHSHPLQ